MSGVKGFLIGMVITAMACILQVIGLVRYLQRLPDDWVGIGLYGTTIVALVIVTFGFYVQWKRQGNKE
ncbi:hypothetical protein ACFLYL_03470 [Chloroflexota bacterium]